MLEGLCDLKESGMSRRLLHELFSKQWSDGLDRRFKNGFAGRRSHAYVHRGLG